MSAQEIEQFIDPYAVSNNNNGFNGTTSMHPSEFYSDMMDKFERELENIDENINVNSLYNMISAVIDDRLEIALKNK